MGSTVASECLSEHMTAPNPLSYQLVTDSWRLVAEVLGLGQVGRATLLEHIDEGEGVAMSADSLYGFGHIILQNSGAGSLSLISSIC
jgi:hypothetical protein